MEFRKLEIENSSDIALMSKVASAIVKEHYDPLLGAEQNDYMIEMFQSVKAITEQLEHGYKYYFCMSDNEIVGFMAFYPKETEMYISKLYLKKEHRGKGYSREMLNFVISDAKRMNLDLITLNVNKYNKSVDIYKSLGFFKIRDEKNDIGNGFFMDDYVMGYRI